jgi:hypothetical protein
VSSKEPVPLIKTSTCYLGISLTKLIASFNNVISNLPNWSFIPAANVYICEKEIFPSIPTVLNVSVN